MDKTTDERPEIGTPRAALEACVTLISAVTAQPEKLMGYYLDLYYQVRRAAEDAAARETMLKYWDVGAPMTVTCENGPPRAQGESAQSAERGRPGPAAPTEEDDTIPQSPPKTPVEKKAENIPQSAAPTAPFRQGGQKQGPEVPAAGGGKKKVDFDEVIASASAGATTPPRKKSEPWGSVKREIRERFLGLRSKGMTTAQAVNLSGKKLSNNDVYAIINGGKCEMKIYTALEDAMNKWEQVAVEQKKEGA